MTPLQFFLRPFSLLYGIAVRSRNLLFDLGIFSSKSFQLPIICVGNLTHGGTGKTPHVMFIVEALRENFQAAVLLRGYRRNTSGFLLVEENTSFSQCGDEAFLCKQKNRDLIVAVDKNRRNGIEQLKTQFADLDCIIMDDGFQHRWVKPGYSILLREHGEFQRMNFMAPSGTLREPLSGSERADTIIISKCPKVMSENDQLKISGQLAATDDQSVFFTYIDYGKITSYNGSVNIDDWSKYDIVLFTGIANSEPLVEYLEQKTNSVKHFAFNDHHNFTSGDLDDIQSACDSISSEKKIILTTEKDMTRLGLYQMKELHLYFIPISIKFHDDGSSEFIKQLSNFVGKSTK